jgi:hypothetical protein
VTPGSALLGAAVACALAIGAACSRPSAGSPDGPGIRLTLPPDGAAGAFIEVVGLSSDDLDALSDARLTTEQWTALLRVSVGGDAPPMLGTYSVTRSALRFTPAFPLDPGRQYEARFDLTGFPHSAGNGRRSGALVTTVSRPATTTTPSTVVARVYPSADVLPENQLRFYIQFSGPMGLRAGLDHVHLVDEHGREVEDPFLPLDLELWNADRTRYTVFVDPGRVKTDLLPQQQLGPSLESGRTYTLVIDSEWRDAAGLPLEQPFRRTFRVGPADEEPIQPDAWTIAAPAPGTRDPLVVTFPEPLDHGLLLRSLGVSYASGARLEGQSRVEARETRWVFVPHAPWRAGDYRLVVLSILEDLAGNQIGRPFEVDRFDEVDDAEPKTILRPFRVGSGQQAVGSRQ